MILHRVKKENDLNHDKWIGIGGKCEEGGESRGMSAPGGLGRNRPHLDRLPVLRPGDLRFGHLGGGSICTCSRREGFTGELRTCDEGDLEWVDRAFLDQLPKWEGRPDFPGSHVEEGPVFLPEAVLHRGNLDLCGPQRAASGALEADNRRANGYRAGTLRRCLPVTSRFAFVVNSRILT